MATRNYCDRCGREVTEESFAQIDVPRHHEVDLCDGCLSALLRWLAGDDSSRSPSITGQRTALIAARKAKGLNQTQLAGIVGTSQSWVSRIESGEMPDARLARALMTALGVSLDDVIDTSRAPTPTATESRSPV